MESDVTDALDRQIVHALCLAPRAPFSKIGAVLGVSDQTIVRRYRRLRSLLGLRVTGRLNGRSLGYVEWFVRLACTPDEALAVGADLSRRRETSWVRVTSGGTEIVSMVVTRGPDDRGQLLLSWLTGSERVIAVSAHRLLHLYRGGTDHWALLLRALSREQADSLQEPTPPVATGVELVADDGNLVDALHQDGRASLAQLGTVTGWHESRVRRRLEELQRARILYLDLDIDGRAYGVSSSALLWMAVEPSRLAAAGAALAAADEVPVAAATTGPSNLLIGVNCRDDEALYDFITTQVGGLAGVQRLETAPVVRTLKRTGPVLSLGDGPARR